MSCYELILLKFQVREDYDERALEALIEVLEKRGAYCKRSFKDGSWYEVRVPNSLDWWPFLATIGDAKKAVWRAEKGEGEQKVIFQAEDFAE